MGSTKEVREATVDDAAEIYGLARQLAQTVGDAPPREEAVRARLGELLEEPRARVLVAEGEGGLVGAASLWIKPDLAHGDAVVEVPMLVVAEDHRREGVGKLLVEEVLNVAAENETNLIELVATSGNVAARDFYRSLGFVEADVVSLEFVGSPEDPPEES
ncbi:MAG: GNAT family N-acetyltransferase [Actinomycetota bacterium]|nr:GNAT family N-acetyltransferase [Actinomycetota bacterium]